jgi:small conductance mechanosensitive channel
MNTNLLSAEVILGLPQILVSWFISHGIKIVVILILALILSKIAKVFVSRVIKAVVEKGNGLIADGQIQEQRAKTLIKVFSSTLKAIIWILAILMMLPELNVNVTPLLAGAGLAGLAIGMGAKNLIQDYLSGLFILLEDQYRVGEEVEILAKKGKVTDLNLRRTVIKDPDSTLHYIPNGQVKSASNFSRK